jgi:transcriptional regulator with PAS, ATPase and Fis domain
VIPTSQLDPSLTDLAFWIQELERRGLAEASPAIVMDTAHQIGNWLLRVPEERRCDYLARIEARLLMWTTLYPSRAQIREILATIKRALGNGDVDWNPRTSETQEINEVMRRTGDGDAAVSFERRRVYEGIIGRSPPMQRLFDAVEKTSATNVTVLILGESGTGKELVARAIHTNSPRKKQRFVAVSCAALSEGLIESELFGYEKGAFTGAVAHKDGLIVYADGGTLFLDEVGEMPLATQAKFLRVLETHEVLPVGGAAAKKADFRLLAATNRDLKDMVRAGTFREDLLYRLQVVTIELPPLRDRRGDLPILIDHFIGEMSRTHQRSVRGITPDARTLLLSHDWPGNVREFRNAIESMVVLGDGEFTVTDVQRALGLGALRRAPSR